MFDISYLICFGSDHFSAIPICVIFISGQTKNNVFPPHQVKQSNMLCVGARLTTNTTTDLKPPVDLHRRLTQDDYTTINTILLRPSHIDARTVFFIRCLVMSIGLYTIFYRGRCILSLRRNGDCPDNSHHYFIILYSMIYCQTKIGILRFV